MPKVRTDQIEIEYDAFGSAENPAVLLIAGLGAQMISWTSSFCELLAGQGYRIVRFDNRDVGLSTHLSDRAAPVLSELVAALQRGERPAIPYSLSDMAGDAVALLDGLGIDRAHVVGRSMGGMIAQLMAADYPERVRSLTSYMSSSGNPGLPPATEAAMSAMTKRYPDLREDLEGYLNESIKTARALSGTGYPFDEEYQRARALAALQRAYDPGGAGRQLAAVVRDGDRRSRLKQIKAPTLVIHGSEDPLIPLPAGQDTADNVKGARLLVYEGMGHDFPPALFEPMARVIAEHATAAW